MNILVTGAKGFVGRNLVENLKTVQDGRCKVWPGLHIDSLLEYDIDTDPALLDEYCKVADFVFNLAGVNRPKDNAEFMEGNFGFATAMVNPITARASLLERISSSSMQRRQERRSLSTDSRIFSVSGVDPTTTVRLRLSATTLQETFQFRSITVRQSLNSSILMTSSTR